VALDLGAQLDAWTKETSARMLAVYKGSVQEFVSRAQFRIPVDTGFARASIRGSFEAMPEIDPNAAGIPGQSYDFDMSSIVLLINSAQPGQTIYIGWTANYVPYLEYGHSQQAPNGFIGITALEWPQIVAGEIEKAKNSVASRK
jgi:hypothetical protein